MNDNVQLQRMTRDDLELVLKLERRCHLHPWSEATFELELDNPVARIDLLYVDGGLAGYTSCWLVADELEIQNIVTAPEWRRRGLAHWMLRQVLSRAAAEQARRALLEVRAGNRAAIALYEQFGFRIDAQRNNYYKDGETAILMSLDDLSGVE
jgi:[ribosomal protein S18]-alanine N-acetyltransferase